MMFKLLICFMPLLIIFILMKALVWLSAISSEQNYVREDSKSPHGPYVANAYADLDEEEEEYGSCSDYK